MMKETSILETFKVVLKVINISLVFVWLYILTSTVEGTGDAPILGAGHSGAPGEVNCSFCHAGTVNSGPGSMSVDMGVPGNFYTPGQTYTASLTLTETGVDKFGFQATVLKDSDGQRSGLPVVTDALNTVFIPDVSRDYIGHTPVGADASPAGSMTWMWDWDAPAADEGPLTAYFAGLATDHSHTSAGDNTYTQTINLLPDPSLNVAEESLSIGIKVYPNPVMDNITIESNGVDRFILYNSSGTKVKSISLAEGYMKRTLLIDELAPGMYIYEVYNKGLLIESEKIIKR